MIKIISSRRNELIEFQKILGVNFRSLYLLNQALIHTSYVNEHKLSKSDSNERLEFLGDAVLNITTSEYLFRRHANYNEGSLTKIKSFLVSEPVLAKESLKLNMGKYMLLGKGEDSAGGRNRDSILSNVYEAVLGAYFVDSGMDKVKDFIVKNFLVSAEIKEKEIEDYKSDLQELIQKRYKRRPVYLVSGHVGPEHKKMFFVKACFRGKVLGTGSGNSKKEAEQQAAKEALNKLKEMSFKTQRTQITHPPTSLDTSTALSVGKPRTPAR